MNTTIAVILTCHNRRTKTQACLGSLLRQPEIATSAISFHVFLCDDGSTDGTSLMAQALLGDRVTVVPGAGNLFWNRGMIAAWNVFVENGPAEFVLLLNDDTVLSAGCLTGLFATICSKGPVQYGIVVGSTAPLGSTMVSYGGFRAGQWWNKLRLSRVYPGHGPMPCDTFNCNIVLAPTATLKKLGFLDQRFIHSMGDIDLGLRATSAKMSILVAPGILGQCDENPDIENDKSYWSVLARVFSVRDCPPGPWLALAHRHAGPMWPILFFMPYIKTMLGISRRRKSS